MQKSKNAFTMVELIFVIVILGVLAVLAIPRLSATRQDASASAAMASWKVAMTQVQASTLAAGVITDFTTILEESANLSVTPTSFSATAGNAANTVCATATVNGDDLNITGVYFGVAGCSLFEGLSTVGRPLLGTGVVNN